MRIALDALVKLAAIGGARGAALLVALALLWCVLAPSTSAQCVLTRELNRAQRCVPATAAASVPVLRTPDLRRPPGQVNPKPETLNPKP